MINNIRVEDKDTRLYVRITVDVPFELWCPMNPLRNKRFHYYSAVKHSILITVLCVETLIGGASWAWYI
jgi:hypothetical protein